MITLLEAKTIQAALHDQGKRLIESLQLVKSLESLGEVHIEGSYLYELMVKPDIDVHVFNTAPNFFNATNIAKSFLDLPGLIRLKIIDTYSNKPKPGEPMGHYIGPKIIFENTPWTIDIWVTHPDIKSDGKTFPLGWEKDLTASQRDTILLLKYQLKEVGRYGTPNDTKFNSADVYRAVFTDGVTTLTELDTWRLTHPFTGGLS